MSVITVNVALDERSYPIYIGQSLLTDPHWFQQVIRGKRVMVITNDTVAPLYLEQLKGALAAFQVDAVILPDGEQYKSLASFETIMSALLEGNHGRDTTLIALGGGVIGDITGFAAACYQRGVDFIQVPTTLLANVDSSVGGKTAVNHPLGKNMIGAFYQPKMVLIDTAVLATLPAREMAAGMAEVIKYGIIWDADFFNWLEDNVERVFALETSALTYAIERCCQIKAQVVAADEKEHGCRALLNLGHTFGHAIEAEQGYGNWLHGEAVGAGMVMAAHCALLRNELTQEDLARIISLIKRSNLPVFTPLSMDYAAFIKHMMRDKKVLAGQLRLVLPLGIGRAAVVSDTSDAVLHQVIQLSHE